MLNLDHAAATDVLPEVLAAHADLCRNHVANPHGTTRYGEASRRAIVRAERDLLGCLRIPEEEARVIWTSGGTEAVNQSVLGSSEFVAKSGVLVDPAAHPAMLEPCRVLEHETEAKMTPFALSSTGELVLPECAPTPACRLAAVCHVNNETGAVADLTALRRWLDRFCPDARLAVDAVQTFGKLPVPWRQGRIDLLALSARKLGGPTGVGALVVRRGVEVGPLLHGGGQQRGLRAGTLDTVGIVEFVMAAQIRCARAAQELEHAGRLHAEVRRRLATWDGPAPVFLSPDDVSPWILCLAFPGYEGALVMRLLAERDVLVGTGSACSAESAKTSHVLAAMGVGDKVARAALRVSFGSSSTTDDVGIFIDALRSVFADW